MSYGGEADEIYRLEVEPDVKEKIKDIYPYSGSIYRDKKEIEGFYDY